MQKETLFKQLIKETGFWLLIATIVFSSGCAFKKQAVFSLSDYVEISKGTVIKDVVLPVKDKDGNKIVIDYVTDRDGAWFSGDAQGVLI